MANAVGAHSFDVERRHAPAEPDVEPGPAFQYLVDVGRLGYSSAFVEDRAFDACEQRLAI